VTSWADPVWEYVVAKCLTMVRSGDYTDASRP
jgi:hypothetical protein